LGFDAVQKGVDDDFINVMGIATDAEVRNISGNLQNQITNEVNLRTSQVVSLSANKLDKTGGTILSDLTIQGNLVVNGTQFISNTEQVSARDNLIVINSGEVGAGVTSVSAGILVDRGTLPRYAFLFDETTDRFKIGTVDNMQPVATREENPLSNGIPYWDSASNRFKNSDSVVTQASGIVTVAGSTASDPAVSTVNIGGGDILASNRIVAYKNGNEGIKVQTFTSAGFSEIAAMNSAGRFVGFGYAGPTFASAPLASGPVGEGAFIYTSGSYPMAFGTAGTCRMYLDTNNTTFIGTAPVSAAAGTTQIGGGVVDTAGDVNTGAGFYLGNTSTDGSWRLVKSGNDLVFQRRESSSWVTKTTITA
jgi:hypothetical protein